MRWITSIIFKKMSQKRDCASATSFVAETTKELKIDNLQSFVAFKFLTIMDIIGYLFESHLLDKYLVII